MENIIKRTHCVLCENSILHRPKRKMRQNAVMTCIFYNYVSCSLLNVLSRFSFLLFLL